MSRGPVYERGGDRKVSRLWRLRIELRDVAPRVWRTILVRPDTKLHHLHRYLAGAMGWEDRHLFAFEIDGREYLVPNREYPSERKTFDVRRYTLEYVCPSLPCAFAYTYDFGDEWIHDVTIEDEEAASYRKQYPICVDGAGDAHRKTAADLTDLWSSVIIPKFSTGSSHSACRPHEFRVPAGEERRPDARQSRDAGAVVGGCIFLRLTVPGLRFSDRVKRLAAATPRQHFTARPEDVRDPSRRRPNDVTAYGSPKPSRVRCRRHIR